MGKEDVVYEYYSDIKKKEILPFLSTWIDLESVMLSAVSQRKTNTTCSQLYIECKNVKQMKRNRLIDNREQTGSCQREGAGG